MIKLYRSKKESRKRDLKRQRFIIEFGYVRYHLERAELEKIVRRGISLLLGGK